MRTPTSLEPLVDLGVIEEVIRPLMSGKEAQVYLVLAEGEERIAKVYKEATERSFKQRADYTEGRRVKNTRSQRAMNKRSAFGREQVEAAWRTAEVDAIYKLQAADVRVPRPYDYVEGVLVMELIRGFDGLPAPRLADVELSRWEARDLLDILLNESVKMLCAGVVHGDLSDFNILIGTDGPVLIDFPQAVDPAFNRNARNLLIRDVDNVVQFLARFAPEIQGLQFGREIWALYEKGELSPGAILSGRHREARRAANVGALRAEIEDVKRDAGRATGRKPPPERPETRPEARPEPRSEPRPPDAPARRRRRRRRGPPGEEGKA